MIRVRAFILLPLLLLLLAGACAHGPSGTDGGALATRLEAALAGDHRSVTNRARDRYRNPAQTLQFFGLRPDMHVVEVWPGTGWYTEVLAPVLRGTGRYYAAHYAPVHPTTTPNRLQYKATFEARLAARPDVYSEVKMTELSAPEFTTIAPPGSADLVLTFRNVHNWASNGNTDAMFSAFYRALKPGGTLGVVEHRARPGTPLDKMISSGYMTEAWVIAVAQKAGFVLQARSEINANPKDSTEHPKGVWSLPPGYAAGDREKYALIGESDRMTLRFVKPLR